MEENRILSGDFFFVLNNDLLRKLIRNNKVLNDFGLKFHKTDYRMCSTHCVPYISSYVFSLLSAYIDKIY